MTVIVLKNWARHQHYKDRDPPWVKLYRDILTSESWVAGTDQSRLVQLASILLAARYSNRIPRAWNLIRKVTNLDCTEAEFETALAHLIATDFLEIQEREADPVSPEQPASATLAKGLHQERREEKSRGEERETRAREVPRGTQDAGTALTRMPSAEDVLAEMQDAWSEVDGIDSQAMTAWLLHWSRVHAGRDMPPHQRISVAKLLAGLGDADTQRRAVAVAEANGWKAIRPGDGRKPPARKGEIDPSAQADSERRAMQQLKTRAAAIGFRAPHPSEDVIGYRTLVERAESNQPRKGGPTPIAKLLGRVQ